MTDKRCPDCKWSFKPPAPAGLNAPPLQCRRNPPNVTAFMVPGRLQGQAQIMSNASFPPVDATTWCGEFAGKGTELVNELVMERVDHAKKFTSRVPLRVTSADLG